MYVRFRGFSSDNSILVENCQFDGNSAEEAGGGASVLFTNDKSVPALTNSIIFRNVSFNRNSAGYGGGVALAAKYSTNQVKIFSSMHVIGPKIKPLIAQLLTFHHFLRQKWLLANSRVFPSDCVKQHHRTSKTV